MPSDYDPTEFVDGDLQRQPPGHSLAPMNRAPSREEVDSQIAAAQQRLAELKREKEDIERERAGLEETRRRQVEFQTGRTEMIQNLTRGLGILEEAEFNARRDAEQMAKTVQELREALGKVEALREETWTRDSSNVELTRALTTLENARMEWNSARLKFPQLSNNGQEPVAQAGAVLPAPNPWTALSFGELSRLGLAVTWPLLILGAGLTSAVLVLLFRR